ncbi:MAG TPA: hypothetical protein VMB21_18210 [Candidatus Limnocylindria bacterium]|nr:hypothetical protein [Candidatus Limnocylindria bacterium]
MLVLLLTCLLLVSAGSVLSRTLERQTTCVADGAMTAVIHERQAARLSVLTAPGTDVIRQGGRSVGEAGGVTWDAAARKVRFQQIRLREGFQWDSPFEFRSRRLELDTFEIATDAGTGDPQQISRLAHVVCRQAGHK